MSGRIRALVAEDHPANQRLIEAILLAADIEAEFVQDGAAAVAAMEASDFHIVLMDIQMPEMDGLEATRRIRENEARDGRKPTPVVAVTACALDDMREAAKSAGVDDYITKPVVAPTLLNAIVKQLQK